MRKTPMRARMSNADHARVVEWDRKMYGNRPMHLKAGSSEDEDDDSDGELGDMGGLGQDLSDSEEPAYDGASSLRGEFSDADEP